MSLSLASAATIYRQHPQRSRNFEIVYLILARGNPGDLLDAERDAILATLKKLGSDVPDVRFRVVWRWINVV